MTAAAETMPFTEFIQHPTASTGLLGGVRALRLRRRDAEDLVVMPADRADREEEILDLVARLLALLVRRKDGRELMQQLLPDLLPWVRFLPTADLATLVSEFVEVVEAATSIRNIAPVAQLLIEWRHTAEIHADPELHRLLSTPRGEDHGAVGAAGPPGSPVGAEARRPSRTTAGRQRVRDQV